MFLTKVTKRIIQGLRFRLDKWVDESELPNEDTIITLWNFRVLVANPRTSIIGRALYLNGVWEAEETAVVKAVVAPGDVVIDVGADIGYYTLLFSTLSGPGGHVYSFEPNPSSKAWLDKNIERNRVDNATTYGVALFDQSGEVSMNGDQILADVGKSTGVLVPTQPFDEWRQTLQLNRVDLVKIDAEGAELRILKGMRHTIQAERPKLLIEIHPTKLPIFSDSADAVIAFLSDARYLVRPVDRQSVVCGTDNLTVLCRPMESR